MRKIWLPMVVVCGLLVGAGSYTLMVESSGGDRTLALQATGAMGGIGSGSSPRIPSLVPEGEAGQPLFVEGVIVLPDGETPAAHMSLFVFHTDDRGYYSETGMDESNPRLHAHLTTDKEGRYRFRTIVPGLYPGGTTARHIHFVVSGPEHPEQGLILHFADDPLVPATIRRQAEGKGTFATMQMPVEGEGGMLNVRFDIRLEPF